MAHCFAMDSSDHEISAHALATIDEAPRYYADLVTQLSKQPLSYKVNDLMGTKMIKILPLKSYDDGRICKMFCDSADIPGYKSTWGIYSNCNSLFKKLSLSYKHALVLFLSNNFTLCLPQDLEKKYAAIIENVQNGWVASTLDYNPDIVCKESEKQWTLFLKQQTLEEENKFIRYLAYKFNMADKIRCRNLWLKPDLEGDLECRDAMYLWVRKDALKEVKSTLKLNLPS